MTALELLENLNLLDEHERVEAKTAQDVGRSLHETRFAETKGSGIRVMREMAEGAGLTPPLFESDRGRDQFVARFFFHHFLGEDDLHWLGGFKDLGLSDADARALVVTREAGAMDNAGYRNLNKVDTLTASSALRRLRDAGLFEQQGRGSATWYKPTPRLLAGRQDPKPDEVSAETERLAPKLAALSSNSEGLSSNPPGLSSNPPGLSSNPDPALQHRQALLAELPTELAQQLAIVGKRHPPQALRDLVVALCAWHPLRAEELGVLLQRQTETVRQDYLRPLLREGRIAMTRPDRPNDPVQAYRAVEKQI